MAAIHLGLIHPANARTSLDVCAMISGTSTLGLSDVATLHATERVVCATRIRRAASEVLVEFIQAIRLAPSDVFRISFSD